MHAANLVSGCTLLHLCRSCLPLVQSSREEPALRIHNAGRCLACHHQARTSASPPDCSNLFTIQGLRPSNISGSQPANCPTNITFDKNVSWKGGPHSCRCWLDRSVWKRHTQRVLGKVMGRTTAHKRRQGSWLPAGHWFIVHVLFCEQHVSCRCSHFSTFATVVAWLPAGPGARAAGTHVLRVAQLPGWVEPVQGPAIPP